MKSESYQKQIEVLAEHIDRLNHVNNVVYLQWVQEMAGEHWKSKSNATFDAAYFWIVIDHFIEYKGQAFIGDLLTAKTYVEKNEGVRSLRVVEFYKDDKLIVCAKTNWCLIDKARNRPTRIPPVVNEMFFND